jgi:hypothetical protein
MTLVYALLLQTPMPPMPPMGPFGYIPWLNIIQSFFITIAVIALGIPIIRSLTRRFIERPPTAPGISADVHDRLERIEQAVDTVAIEVERISESQRYLTKLMSDARALPRGSAGGSGTPNKDA